MNQNVDRLIEQKLDQMIAWLRELLKIESVATTQPEGGYPYGVESARALEKGIEMCERVGLKTKNFDNQMAHADFGENPKLGILTHLDVVAAGNGWETPPFEGTLKDGKLYGRGTTDDKGPFIYSLFALMCIKELGIPLKRGVRLIFGAAEETGIKEDVRYYARQTAFPECVYSPDGDYPVYNGEKGIVRFASGKKISVPKSGPSLLELHGGLSYNVIPEVATARVRGISLPELQQLIDRLESEISFTLELDGDTVLIRAKGIGGHGAWPEHYKNPLTALIGFLSQLPLQGEMGSLLSQIAKTFPHGDCYGKAAGIAWHEDCLGDLTVTFAVMDYDGEELVLKNEIRYPMGATKEEMLEKAKVLMESVGLDYNGKLTGTDPHYSTPDSELVQTLLDVLQSYTGLEKECKTMGGGSYVHEIEGGVLFGPGMPGGDNYIHDRNEFIELDQLLQGAKMTAQIILKLCG